MANLDSAKIRSTVWGLTGFEFSGKVKEIENDGVFAAYDGKNATVGGGSPAMLARAYFLLAKNISDGKKQFEISQKPAFDDCGVMLDMSRNGVMTVESVKRFIDNMAALGMNYLMLYTEDTYELKEYPLLGYMRGRYTAEDLKEIDDYAYSLGIELVPCIQTLAHMEQFLHWYQPYWDMGDTPEIMMIDNDNTYRFIETAIKTLSECFRSKRIHVGMDEAHFVGLGRFLDNFGYQNRFDLLSRHVTRVCEICEKYGRKAMMWSDMYFRLLSKGNYYGGASEFPQEVLDKIPNIGMVYWDYYHTNEPHYDGMIKAHKSMGKEVIFAGGIQTWYGGLPRFDNTEATSFAALRSCIRNGVKSAVATMWGDDGCETNAFMTLPQLPVYSEFCYIGEDCTMDDVKSVSSYLTGVDYDRASDFGHATFPIKGTDVLVKPLVFSDIMYDLGPCTTPRAPEMKRLAKKYAVACARDAKIHTKGRYNDFFKYAEYYYRVVADKAELKANLRAAYANGDKEYILNAAKKIVPAIKRNVKKLAALHEKIWLSDYKPFGLEVIEFRYGGVLARLDYAEKTLLAYANGETKEIPELAHEYREDARATDWVRGVITPSYIH